MGLGANVTLRSRPIVEESRRGRANPVARRWTGVPRTGRGRPTVCIWPRTRAVMIGAWAMSAGVAASKRSKFPLTASSRTC